MLRKILFWAHLVAGVVTGLVILMMSVTGVLLTYERQILDWADRAMYADPVPGAQRQPLEAIIDAAKAYSPGFNPTSLGVRNDPRAPISVSAGRDGTLYVNPYTGATAEQGAQRLRSFFRTVTSWHRWFGAEGEHRATARAITGASNLAFLFLILSGMYLWLPRVYKWAAFKMRLLFNPQAKTGKARDYNWHHVLGIWSAIPLVVVVASATVFSYPWANDLVYRAFGEEPPARGARGPGGGGAGSAPGTSAPGARRRAAGEDGSHEMAAAPMRLPYDDLLARVAERAGGWRTITLTLPNDTASTVRFQIDRGNGGQPQYRDAVVVDALTGAIVAEQPFASQTPGQRARSWIRFLHTGEAFGIAGQTIAGIVSLTSVVMVWTGLALAYRRLIQPLFRRRAAVAAEGG